MAVAPMTKAQVMIHGAVSSDVVKRIYDLGVLQAVEVVEESTHGETRIQRLTDDMAYCLSEFEGRLRDVSRSLEILTDVHPGKRQIIENFITLKQRLPRQVLDEVQQQFDFLKAGRELRDLYDALKQRQEHRQWLLDNLALLDILAPLDFPLSGLQECTRVRAVVGRVRQDALAELQHVFADVDEWLHVETIAEHGQQVYLFVLCLPTAPVPHARDAMVATFEQHGFEPLDLGRYSGTIAEEIAGIRRAIATLDAEIADALRKIGEFSQYHEHFRIIEDILLNEIERCKSLQHFAETDKVYLVEGWLKQQDVNRLKAGLQEFDDSIALHLDDAAPDDESVPVILENPPYLQPFEVITRMFGMPKYTEPDPTPMLAPFFILFFGLCLTDAGYGIALALLMAWLLRTYALDTGTVQLAQLLKYGGCATIVCGALTGGWLGDIVDFAPAGLRFVATAKDAIVLIDPLKQPIQFLGIALLLGYGQICYGIWLKMRHRMKRGHEIAALLDEGVWLIFINSVMGLLIVSASGMRDVPATYGIGQGLLLMFLTVAVISGGLRIWFHNREESNLIKRVLSGVLSLYDVVGIFSDILSYSRLLALGLATGVIASVVGMLALMVGEVPVIGVILGIVVFGVGHLFNLVINALGSFIHSGRLQFVEFFSKFFEAGGKKYQPFKFESRYFVISEK
jgi:V/A-type H+/Na+-transporting ATPase subunit I